MTPRFVNGLSVPPGGYFFELDGVRVKGRCLDEILPRVRRLMAEKGVAGDAESALAAYMCPRMGIASKFFCAGDFDRSNEVSRAEALQNSLKYFAMPAAPFDRIERRLARCMACPKRFRGWCLTCTGHYEHLMSGFGPKRPRLPVDRGTGVCKCARAYEAAVASVEYGPDDKIWEGAPETCWRNSDV